MMLQILSLVTSGEDWIMYSTAPRVLFYVLNAKKFEARSSLDLACLGRIRMLFPMLTLGTALPNSCTRASYSVHSHNVRSTTLLILVNKSHEERHLVASSAVDTCSNGQ